MLTNTENKTLTLAGAIKMKKVVYGSFLIASTLSFSNVTLAKHATLEDCIKAVSSVKSGLIARAEYHNFSHEGSPAYEIEVIDKDGKEWEFECNKHGNIVEIEQEVKSASDPLFKSRAKVSEEDAKATATTLYKGKVEKVEYEIEFDGSPSYEFNIETDDGTEFNVEVSAESGEIIEVSTEGWEIGIDE